MKQLKENITEILALLITICSFMFLFMLIYHQIPTENKDIVNISIGFVLGSFVAGVSGYYFGASKKADNIKADVSIKDKTTDP